MADLPSYQSTGRVYSDLPQLDFANVRESFKQSQTMSNQLDRLSSYAFTEMGKATEAKAEQFALDNPITKEDLINAQSSGIDLIKASGGGQIWEDTLRKFQGEQLRSQLEVYGQAALIDILAKVDRKEITDPNEIKQKLESAITGFEKPLANISPESAVKFKQSMGASASAFYKEATKKLTADYLIDQQILAEENYGYTIKAAKAMIESISDPEMLNEAKNLLFKQYYNQAKEGGSEFGKNKANEFLKEFDNLVVNSFVKYTSTGDKAKDFAVINRMVDGDFGDEGKNIMFASLDVAQQDKIRQIALNRRNDNFAADKNKDEADRFTNRVQIRQDKEKLLSGDLPYSEAMSLATSMHSKGYIDDSLFKTISNPSEVDGNAELLGKIQYNIAMGVYKTPYDVPDSDYASLNKQQRKSVWSFSANKQVQENVKGINAAVTDMTSGSIDTGKYATITKISEIVQRKTKEAVDANKPFDLAKINAEAITEVQSDMKIQNLISEQKNAYDNILRIPTVNKYSNKFDIRNVESFIAVYGDELDDEDIKALRKHSLKFNGYISSTLKSWKDFSSNAK